MSKHLGEFVKIKTGKLNANAGVENGDYPFFTCSETPSKIDSYSYDCECALVAGNGTLNVKYYNGKFDAYQRTYIIESLDKNILSVRYLYYFLCSYVDVLRNNSLGGIVKFIKLSHLADAEINLPRISEQKRICAILDLILSINEECQQLANFFEKLVKSQFNTLFGDCNLVQKSKKWVHISDVANVVSGSTPKTNHPEYWGGRYYWITPDEIGDDSFYIYETNRKITDEAINSCSLHVLPKSTVLLTTRAPIGKVAIAGVDMYCNQGFKNIVCSSKLNPVYVFYLLKYNESFLNSLGRGATFKEISKTIVNAILIPCPDIEKQNVFESFVVKINESKLKLKELINKLDNLYKSLLQKYFG